MAKSMNAPPKPPDAPEVLEQRVVIAKRLGNDRYQVLEGTIRGPLENVRVLEKEVSLPIARVTMRMRREKLGLEGIP